MDFEREVIPTDENPDTYDLCAECNEPTLHYHEDYRIWMHPDCLGAWLGSRWP